MAKHAPLVLLIFAALAPACQVVIGYEKAEPAEEMLVHYGDRGQSCLGGLSCAGGSCCDAPVVNAGTFEMGRGIQPHQASVAVFALDAYEVTVGRFRKLVEAYEGVPPPEGAGAHPYIPDSGWRSSWNGALPATRAALETALSCDASTAMHTWTGTPGAAESHPINCVSWYLAFMFCAWDGGRLPTEAEWEYAATGGEEHRVFPWGPDEPTEAEAAFDCVFDGAAGCLDTDLPAVGSAPGGRGKWHQLDMAGSLWEWVLDAHDPAWYQAAAGNPCHDCANVSESGNRVIRGGAFDSGKDALDTARREPHLPSGPGKNIGFRCARTP